MFVFKKERGVVEKNRRLKYIIDLWNLLTEHIWFWNFKWALLVSPSTFVIFLTYVFDEAMMCHFLNWHGNSFNIKKITHQPHTNLEQPIFLTCQFKPFSIGFSFPKSNPNLSFLESNPIWTLSTLSLNLILKPLEKSI